MKKDYIQWALDNQKYPIRDKTTVSELKEAAKDITEKIMQKPALLINCLLTALPNESEIKDKGVFIDTIKESIKKHWTTFKADVPDAPMPYIRHLLLNVISSCLVSPDEATKEKYQNILWLTSRYWASYISIGDHKEDIRVKLETVSNDFIENANQGWLLKLSNESKAFEIDEDELEAGNTSDAFYDVLQKLNTLHNRHQLLWWKESLYSPTLKSSYRVFSSIVTSVSIAKDISLYAPIPFPPSIEALMKETLRTLCLEHSYSTTELRTFKTLLEDIQREKEIFLSILSKEDKTEDRITLLAFVSGLVYGNYSIKEFKDKVGIDAKNTISLNDFCIWLFYDFQVKKLINS